MQTLLELSRRYCEPHRHYHDLRHIADLLLRGRVLALNDEQVAAIWFHDAVYDPLSRENEAQSADLARKLLARDGWQAARVEAVAQIILDTRSHQPTHELSAPVLDLDMSTLAGSWDDYQRYAAQIRAEYHAVPELEWRKGRQSFLKGLLARPRLYWTDWGAAHEAPARANLQRELEASSE